MTHCIFKCTEDGFFSDATDCWIYHICIAGTHSVRACDEDLFFNPKTGQCDWPMNVDCKQATTTRRATTIATTSTKMTTHQKILATTKKGQQPEEEPVDSSETMCAIDDYGYMAHPKDCRKYIYCQDGIAKIFNCQGGLLWKQSDTNCVWPLDSDCPSIKKTTAFTNPLVNNNNNNGGFNNFNQMTSAQAGAMLKENYGTIDCPLDATGFSPNPYDCSAYHFCNGGKDQVILCEPGLHYRPSKQVCDWPVNSDCQPKCPNNVEKFRFLDPKSCCRYYECVNGRLIMQLCQYPLLFDTYTKQCLDYTKVKCGVRKDCTNPCQYFTNEDPSLCEMVPSCNNKPQGVYLDQNRPSCQFFYSCRDNRVFNHTRCGGNLRFNQFEGRCMPPNFVTCSGGNLSSFSNILLLFLFLIFLL